MNKVYNINGAQLAVVEEERDLGVVISNDLKVSQQCAKSSSAANKLLGCIMRTFCSRNREVILPLYKAIVRPQLEYAVQAWRPYLQKDITLLESVQHRATRFIDGMKGLKYEERLTALRLPSLEYRRVRGDIIETFKIYKGWAGINFTDFFELNTNRLRGHDAKIYKQRFNTNIGKFRFCNRVIDIWNDLPVDLLHCSTLNNFKTKLDKHMRSDRGML